MGPIRAHVRIYGRVQGVFFRQNTAHHAEQLGISGWVRNCGDGSVEALFEGDEEAVERILEWCRNGPAGAHVERMDVEKSVESRKSKSPESDGQESIESGAFEIRY